MNKEAEYETVIETKVSFVITHHNAINALLLQCSHVNEKYIKPNCRPSYIFETMRTSTSYYYWLSLREKELKQTDD